MDLIKEGDDVLFYYNGTKKWLARVRPGAELHTHLGVIRHAEAAGRRYGARLYTNKNKYVYLLRPSVHDYIMKMQHGTQIVYPKELGYIAARAGVCNGQKIVEIGTGSGSMTTFLASIVKPRGRVYTFDVDEKFMKIAAKNIERAGVSRYVTQKKADLKGEGSAPVRGADAVMIDLGDPWEVLPSARRMLKGGGALVSVCPTMNQLEKLSAALVQHEFTDIECSETLVRAIEAREGRTRHAFQGIGHTTYLCFARKAFFDEAEP